MRSTIIVLLIPLVILLSGCRADSSAAPTVGPLGVVEDSSAGLAGIDANGNGLRDDIDLLIAQQYSTSIEQHKAAEQEAKAVRAVLLSTSTDEISAAASLSARAIHCVFATFDESRADRLITDIEALTANTRERVSAYLRANALASGMIVRGVKGNTCD